MRNTVGYMLTWSTYGTWLQGNEKGYVKDGEIRGGNAALERECARKVKGRAVRFGSKEKRIVREAILEASQRFRQKIRALAVYSNHVHLVAEYVDVPIDVVVGYYKDAAREALRREGLDGKVWTRGYDKRFCFDDASLEARIAYVVKHEEG
jgi:REP element-mobilizing transposase RayT